MFLFYQSLSDYLATCMATCMATSYVASFYASDLTLRIPFSRAILPTQVEKQDCSLTQMESFLQVAGWHAQELFLIRLQIRYFRGMFHTSKQAQSQRIRARRFENTTSDEPESKQLRNSNTVEICG
jgi:hypothetical protein